MLALDNGFSLGRLFILWSYNREGVMWRHDIDNHLHYARRMARLEERIGVQATYFLHAETPEYDATSGDFHDLIEELLERGHQLGTHVDLARPRDARVTDEELVSACEKQSATLSRWPVGKRVSLHRPPHDTVWRDIPGFEHALSPFWQGRYSADSRYRFRTAPEPLLRSEQRVQINLHPCWWFMEPSQAAALSIEHEREAAAFRELDLTAF